MPNAHAKQPTAALDGIVLAAGRSSRMGTPKAALDAGGATFVVRAVDALRDGGCRDVLVVIGPDEGGAGSAAAQAGAHVVVNTAPDSEQIDSLRLGLRNLNPGALGAVVLPVDHPMVSSATVRAVVDAWERTRAPIVRASHRGEPGHPTIFAVTVFDDLLRGELPDGARTVVAAHQAELVDVPVDDEGVTTDIDTPDDYRRALGREP
ncbi:MAG TPA: nucleotidyltransferase family protein [Longimicrobiales bacterium]